VKVYINENDCYGNSIGKANQIIIYNNENEQIMHLETRDWLPKPISTSRWQIRIYGKIFKVERTGTMIGNVFWDSYDFSDGYLLGFIQAIQDSGEWDCIEAWTKIYNKWEIGELINWQD
jgi:hypothetical protein